MKYVIQLIVLAMIFAGCGSSSSSSSNTPPVANAGPDQNVTVGDTVTFDGSGSIDKDGTIVSWVWDENGTEIGTGETFTKSDFTAGTHTVVLTVTDDKNATGSDEVVITVNAPGNLVPVATPQSVTTMEDTALSIILSGTDPESQPLTYAIDSNASNGTLSITDNNVTYTPNANFNGSDSFTFTVNDGNFTSAAATVDINVTAAPDVLKTGQTTIYNSGDDGFYQKGVARSYTDNGDDTVTDNVTGLMWQNDSDVNNVTRPWDANATRVSAVAECTTHTTGGYNDWRLPTRAELVSISDFGKVGPAIDPVFTWIVTDTSYWSATETAGKPTEAWSVNSYYGGEYSVPKTTDNFIRCVRTK